MVIIVIFHFHFKYFISTIISKNNIISLQIICVGLDKIEFLQAHNIREIYQKAFSIIEQYFSDADEEDARVAPSANNNEYEFNNDQSVPMGEYNF